MTEIYSPASPSKNRNDNNKKTTNRMRNFHFRYLELCRSKNYAPLQEIKAKNKETTILDFFGDKCRLDDWLLIIQSLLHDHTLQQIGIKLRKNLGYVMENLETEKKARMLKNKPAVFTKFIFDRLMDSITNSIKYNTNLNTLALEALPLNENYVTCIAKAMQSNESLRIISFNRSSIGDKGCEVFCSTIKYLIHIENIKLSECDLTSVGANHIADMLKFQKIYRYTEGWKKSLRYRDVDAESIPGLKSICISHNQEIGDKGVELITEILKEDSWIKEIYMSDCGLTDIGANFIVDCLEINKFLQEFEIKNNSSVSPTVIRNIHKLLGKGDERENCEMTKKGKVRVAKILENLKLFEDQIAMEKTQRKHIESLNDELHTRIRFLENQLKEKDDRERELTLPEGYIMVKKESFDAIIKEKDYFRTALSAVKITKSRNNFKKIAKIRKAKSETKYLENNVQRYNNTQSEHALKGKKATIQNGNIFVEKTIGDTPMTASIMKKKTESIPIQKPQIQFSNENLCFSSNDNGIKNNKLPQQQSAKLNNFKGIEEALRLFVKKKNNCEYSSNREVTNVKTLFMGNQNSSY